MRFYEKYYPGNSEELITYYPKYYRDVLEMRAILEAHGAVLDELEDNIERVFFNSFIDTADEQAITDLERFLDIKLNRARSLETRRRFVKAFFVGFGKVSASLLAAIINSYTEGPVEASLEPFDSAGNNLLKLLYGRGEAETLYIDDIDYLLSKKIPAHIAWQALLTYRSPIGIGVSRQHYWFDYEVAGTKPEITTLGSYTGAASVIEAHRYYGVENYFQTEQSGVRSGQIPTDALIGLAVRAESVTQPNIQRQTVDYGTAAADGSRQTGTSPEEAVIGRIVNRPIATEPGADSRVFEYRETGVSPEAAQVGRIIRRDSVTDPNAESGVIHYTASGTSPEEALTGRIISRESVTKPAAENAVTDIPATAGDSAGLYPEGNVTGAEAINAGAGARAESFSVDYRNCGTSPAGS